MDCPLYSGFQTMSNCNAKVLDSTVQDKPINDANADSKLADKLCWILCDGFQDAGLYLDFEGYVEMKKIYDVGILKEFGGPLDIQRVVKNDKRFTTEVLDHKKYIRCHRGLQVRWDVQLSKTLSFLLRHGARRVGLHINAEGFVSVDEILKRGELKEYSFRDVERVVSTNAKQRFTLKEENGVHFIRANQGHTLEVEKLDLKEITQATEFPTVVHGTYMKHWAAICRQGLSRQGRQHIHFAPGEPGNEEVISGMRNNCDVLIYLNLPKALGSGLKFYLSSNNVILSPGNESGYIEPQYFDRVVRKHEDDSRTELPIPEPNLHHQDTNIDAQAASCSVEAANQDQNNGITSRHAGRAHTAAKIASPSHETRSEQNASWKEPVGHGSGRVQRGYPARTQGNRISSANGCQGSVMNKRNLKTGR